MKENTIIIKASDYKYPTRDELRNVYKTMPDINNFGFTPYDAINLFDTESSITDIDRDNHLAHWNGILLNRNGALAHTYVNAIVHFKRGVPDDIKHFENTHYINRIQFDYYSEIFYYYFSTVKDTIAQILNKYYKLGFSENKLYFDNILNKVQEKTVIDIINNFLNQTKLAHEYRNSFAHRTPINFPDSRTEIELQNSTLTYRSATNSFLKSSVIKANLDITINAIAIILNELKTVLT